MSYDKSVLCYDLTIHYIILFFVIIDVLFPHSKYMEIFNHLIIRIYLRCSETNHALSVSSLSIFCMNFNDHACIKSMLCAFYSHVSTSTKSCI